MTKIRGNFATAAKVANCAEFRDVRLLQVEGGLAQTPSGEGSLTYALDVNVVVQYESGEPVLVVRGTYKLEVAERIGDDDETNLASAEFELAGLFSLEDREGNVPESFEEAELDAFAESSGSMALYPFAREFIHDLTGRFSLPPLTIGLLKIAVEQDELALDS